MEPDKSFRYELEHSEVTTVKCHGRLVIETRDQLAKIFKETPFQGRIVFDLGDVNYMDSAGLGALIKLKLSADKHGGVSVNFVNMTPRTMQLLKVSNLTDWFAS
jgi:anti-sigma B factor antagonist